MSRYILPFARTNRLPFLVVTVSVFAFLGCSIFPTGSTSTQFSSGRPILPPIQAAPDTILLEVFFIERPQEDPLLSTSLWKDVDQIGAVPTTETRQILRENGFRVGNASSHPPASVQKLLGMVAEIPLNSSENSGPLLGRHQFLAPGVETEIPTGIIHDECEFLFHEAGGKKSASYENVNCVLRMKANRLQEGWIRIDFQPEIHHGENQLRRTAAGEAWSLKMSQKIDVRVAQRFSMTLNVGELALITAIPHEEGTLGDRFFCRDDQGTKKQRVLCIRVVEAGSPAAALAR
ncbi:hypothetical protein [Schlesneria sp. T3-172]|uniref:hypothetical protein n=2 Tax=Planctomycetaceae TaxID=126 RepID=UPI0037C872D8